MSLIEDNIARKAYTTWYKYQSGRLPTGATSWGQMSNRDRNAWRQVVRVLLISFQDSVATANGGPSVPPIDIEDGAEEKNQSE